MRILEIHPLHVSQKVMGYSGILYPVRSVGSYLIFILKLALIGLIIVIVYVLDRWIYAAINDKQIIKEETRAFKQENGLDDEEEEGVTKSNLDWIENYIEESEVKRK